jgi:F0F1-type ATP synthase membrane subunit c/vacuolar-type H+-ATPase subunit K
MAPTLPSGKVGKIVVRVSRKPQPGTRMPRFLKPLILFAAALAIGGAALGTAQPAQARSMSTCSSALIHDWYVDGRVDKTYPLHCYREALKEIPEDQAIYGTLRDDLTRALQSTIRQHGGHVNANTPVAPPGGPGDGDGGNGPNGTGKSGGVFHWLAQKLGPSTADSIPIPLLILGGLAFALIAAAGVSLIARRMQARRAAADPPPAGPSF